MEAAAHENMAEVADAHWWFVARRRIFTDLIKKLNLPPDANILEAGCASGANLATFAQFGTLHGFEYDPTSAERAKARGIGQITTGRLPDQIPFAGTQFDLIALPDVLEHVEHDQAALEALRDRLAPKGYLLITVPAFPFLWSIHDIVHHHFRRYTLGNLIRQVESTGLTVRLSNYFNFWLFPPIALIRILENAKLLPRNHAWHTKIPHPLLNKLLTNLFASERFMLPAVPIPYGVSAILIAQRA